MYLIASETCPSDTTCLIPAKKKLGLSIWFIPAASFRYCSAEQQRYALTVAMWLMNWRMACISFNSVNNFPQTARNISPVHHSPHVLHLAISNSADHWQSTSKGTTSDIRWKAGHAGRCTEPLSLQQFNTQYITGTNFSIHLLITYRNIMSIIPCCFRHLFELKTDA